MLGIANGVSDVRALHVPATDGQKACTYMHKLALIQLF